MPTVPTYDAPQVAPQPLQPVQANLNLNGLGSGLAQGLSQFGQAADTIADQVKDQSQKAHAAAQADAKNELQGSINNATYDPQYGVMNLKGEAAVAASVPTYENLEKDRQNIANQFFTNDEDRQAFLAESDKMLEGVHRSVEGHVGQQIQVANHASMEGLKATSLDAVANSYNDPAERARLTAQPEPSIRALQLSQEDGNAQVAAWRSKVAATVLNQYIDHQDYGSASAYFAQEKTTLGAASGSFEKTLQQLQGQVSGRVTAQSMIQVATNPESGLVDEAKLNEALGKLPPDYPHYKDVQEALVPLREQAERANRGLVNQRFTQAFSVLDSTHSLNGVPAEIRSWLIQFAPEKWNELETKAHELDARGRRDTNAANTPEESAAYGDALKDLNDNRYDWMDKDAPDFVSKWGSRLSPRDLHEAVQRFAKLKEGRSLETLPAPEAAAVQRVFQGEMGLPAQQKQWDPTMVDRFHKVLDLVKVRRAEDMRNHKGVEPTQESMDGWTRELLVKQPIAGSGVSVMGHTFFQSSVPSVDTAPPADFVRDISARVRKAKGREPTQDEIRALYQKQQARQKGP